MSDEASEPHEKTPGKIARVVTEAILGAHPVVAALNVKLQGEYKEKFLDGLEEHTAKLVNPILHSVSDVTTLPPELVPLMSELGMPTEQFTGIISQFFIFGVMFNVAGAMLAPFVQQIQNDVWTAHPDRPISPPDVATAVVRGIGYSDTSGETVPDWAYEEAAKSGYGTDAFNTMVGVTGMAPALQLLFEMVRRGIIEEGTLDAGGTTLTSGIQQSDVKDEWIETVSKLRYVQPSPIDMVRAAVQDQWDDAPDGYDFARQKEWAITLGLEPAAYLGDNPDWFNVLLNSAGRPPGPEEMGVAANRGIIPWQGRGVSATTFEQAISESDIKNKWTPILQQLAVHWPAAGDVRTLLMHGGIDVAQATAYWQALGTPTELLDAYLYISQVEQVTQDRALAKGDILLMLQENAITDEIATELLQQIGYSGANAVFLIAMAHFRYELEALRSSIRQVSTMYTSGAITAAQAREGLEGLGMPPAQIDQVVATLQNQRKVNTVLPTAAQIASALFYQVISQDEAQTALENQGYSPFNAWLVLSVRMHGPLPDPPGSYVPPEAPPTSLVPIPDVTSGTPQGGH